MRYQRNLALLGVCFLVIITMVFFYLSTKPPQKTTESLEANNQPLTAPVVTYIDPVRGDDEAPITIVEFTDFTCFGCQNMAENIALLQTELPEKIRHVFKVVPNDTINPFATITAVAAYCAGEQGRFWNFHDALFSNQTILTNESLNGIAATLDLEMTSFQSCLNDLDTLPLVERNDQEARELGVTGLPTIFIGEERYTGQDSFDQLEYVIRELLLKLETEQVETEQE